MKPRFIRVSILLVLLTNLILSAFTQESLRLLPADSRIIITGTSNLHDWEETVGQFEVALVMKFEKNEILGIDRVHFSCKSASISSDNSIMTNKTMDALRTDKYPEIVFTMVSLDKLTSTYGKFSGVLTGDLDLAGVKKRISIAFSGHYENHRIKITAARDINLNDFNIKPPTAMMGALKTGENVVISFQLQFSAGYQTD
jgi:polyisoprenoid-binding protein YceI